jgi:O-acetyl-ADP-ribose deacetylase (regulator of RNase III)
MKVVLFAINEQVVEGWGREFHPYGHDVTIVNAPLEDVPACDCLVAAGNGFGIMDGGLDAAMALQFPDVVQNVRDGVATEFYGEMPVGQAMIVPTGDEIFRWLAYTPTMRFPRPIAAELVYDATRAALIEINRFNRDQMVKALDELGEDDDMDSIDPPLITSVAIPALGAHTGEVKPFAVAKMMRLAYESIAVKGTGAYEKWDDAEAWLKKLYGR